MDENSNDNNMNLNEGEPILRPEFSQNSMNSSAVQEPYTGPNAGLNEGTNAEPNEGPNAVPNTEPPKKKKKTALIVVIAVVAALAALAGSVYCFAGDYVRNTFAMITKDDKEYFRWLSKKAVDEQIEEMKLAYEKAEANRPEAAEISGGRISFAVDMSKELTDLLELPELQRMGLSFAASGHESQVNMGVSASYKDIEVLTVNAMADMDAGSIFAEIPTYKEGIIDLTELIKKSLEAGGYSMEFNPDSFNFDSLNPENVKLPEITGDQLAELYKKYAYYIIDSVNEVSIIKDESADIDDTEVEYSSVNAKLDTDEIIDITKGLLEMMKDEELFADILAESGADSSSIESACNEIIRGLDELSAEDVEMEMEVRLFVNNRGQLIGGGMEVEAEQTEIEIESVGVCEDERNDSDVTINMNGLTVLTIEVRGEDKDNCYNGTVEIRPGKFITAALGKSDDIVIRIECKDIITEDTSIASGTVILSADLSDAVEEMINFPGLSDYEFIVGYESDDKQGEVSFNIKKSGEDFVSFDISAEEIEFEPFVTEGKQIYNFADNGLAEYIDINRLAAYILELHDKLQDETFDNLILSFAPFIVGEQTDFDGLKQIYDEGGFLKLDEMVKDFLAGDGDASADRSDYGLSADLGDAEQSADPGDNEPADENPDAGTEGSDAAEAGAVPFYDAEKGVYYYPFNYYGDYVENLYYDGVELLCIDGVPSDRLLWNLFGDGFVPVEDRGAQFGDNIVFDATLVIGGMPISDYSLTDSSIVLGDYTYGEGVDEQAVGMMPGDSKDVSVVLGEEYGEFAGFEGDFRVTVKEIYEYIPAGWNEKYIVDYLGYESLDACLESLGETLPSVEGLSEADIAGRVFQTAVSKSSYYEPDETFLIRAYKDYYDMMGYQYAGSGMTLEEYYESMGMTEEDLTNEINSSIEAYFAGTAFTAAVADIEGICVTEEEYGKALEYYVSYFGLESVEELEAKISKTNLLAVIIEERVMQLVYDRSAVIK